MLKGVRGSDRKLLLSTYMQSASLNSTVFTALTVLFFVQLAMQIVAGSFSNLVFLVIIFAILVSVYVAFIERMRYLAALRLFVKS